MIRLAISAGVMVFDREARHARLLAVVADALTRRRDTHIVVVEDRAETNAAVLRIVAMDPPPMLWRMPSYTAFRSLPARWIRRPAPRDTGRIFVSRARVIRRQPQSFRQARRWRSKRVGAGR